MILWLTGLSGSGKTTVATEVARRLRHEGQPVCVLDGDELRRGVNSDLGFSPAERTENVRRVAEMAKLTGQAGLIVVVALISPFRQDRAKARKLASEGGVDFIEVHLDCPLHVCEGRDPKGLYRKARTGEIAAFTGIDATYEAPENPEITLQTAIESPTESTARLEEVVRFRLIARAETRPPK